MAFIKEVKIKNFKSIREISFQTKRVNVFIGEPNVGKSNILSAIGLISTGYGANLSDIARVLRPENLFYDNQIGSEIEITLKSETSYCSIKIGQNFEIEFIYKENFTKFAKPFTGFHNLDIPFPVPYEVLEEFPIKFYKFRVLDKWTSENNYEFLKPIYGENLARILVVKKEIYKLVSDILKEFGFKLVLEYNYQNYEMKIQKETDMIIQFPYYLLSDTLQRVIFYLCAIKTNKNSILIFEEPESHSFPYWAKFLAETIALDSNNQYFISTHNPYILIPIIEKTKAKDFSIFIVKYNKEKYETEIKPLSKEKLNEILEGIDIFDIFFNLD